MREAHRILSSPCVHLFPQTDTGRHPLFSGMQTCRTGCDATLLLAASPKESKQLVLFLSFSSKQWTCRVFFFYVTIFCLSFKKKKKRAPLRVLIYQPALRSWKAGVSIGRTDQPTPLQPSPALIAPSPVASLLLFPPLDLRQTDECIGSTSVRRSQSSLAAL